MSEVLELPHEKAIERTKQSIFAEYGKEEMKYGVKAISLLSKIPQFDISRDCPYDPMHVLLEGLGKRQINYMFKE